MAHVSDLPRVEGHKEVDQGLGSLIDGEIVVILQRVEDKKVGNGVNGGVEKLQERMIRSQHE